MGAEDGFGLGTVPDQGRFGLVAAILAKEVDERVGAVSGRRRPNIA